MSRISSLDAVKIQARTLKPVLAALEERIGKEEAHRLVGEALADAWVEHAHRDGGRHQHPRDVEGDFPVDGIIVTDTPTHYRTRMENCQFATWFRSIGEPELGALLTCNMDYAIYARTCSDWDFKRPVTQMMGSDHCDFCFERRNGEAAC